MAYHLAIFVENKPGKLERITKILADNINIYGIYLASVGPFGVVMLTNRRKRLTAITGRIYCLQAQGNGRTLPDRPGECKLLLLLAANAINIEDCYGFVLEAKAQAARPETEKYPLLEGVLTDHSYNLLPADKLSTL